MSAKDLLLRLPVASTTSRDSTAAWIWIIVGVGGLLRLITLGRQSIWLDEGLSFWTANRPFAELFSGLWFASNRPLHYLILQPMISLGGSEFLLRLPSAVAGTASIGLFYALGKELFGLRTGLVASFLLALSPFHIWYSQEARFYALAAVLMLAAGLSAVRAIETNRPRDWILFSLFQALALYTESAAVWFVLAFNAAALLMAKHLWRSGGLLPWTAAQLLALLIFIPGLVPFMSAIQREGPSWIPPATLRGLVLVIADFAGGLLRSRAEILLVLVLLALGMAAGMKGLVQDAKNRVDPYVLIGCWLILPLGMNFLISQPYSVVPVLAYFFPPGASVFLPRNLITATFPLYLLLARSFLLARRPLGITLLAVFVALNGFAYLGNSLPERKEDYRGAAGIVAAQAEPGDVVLFAPPVIEAPFAYYYSGNQPGLRGLPVENFKDGVISEDQSRYTSSPLDALDGSRRAWLITTSNIYLQDELGIAATIETRGRLTGTWRVEGLTIRLFDLDTRKNTGVYSQ